MKQASHKATVTLYDSTYVRYLEKSLSQRQEVEHWLARAGVEKEKGKPMWFRFLPLGHTEPCWDSDLRVSMQCSLCVWLTKH